MKFVFPFLILLMVLTACQPDKKKNTMNFLDESTPKNMVEGPDFSVPVYDFDEFETLLEQDDEYTYIINFWATWCAPCVTELPFFEKLGAAYPDEKIRVVLVNLDMAKMWDSHLVPFLEKRDLKSYVLVLDDPSQNSWIPKVDKDWSGAIPATLIYNKRQRKFYEKPFSFEELQTELNTFLNHRTHETSDHSTDTRRGTPGFGVQPGTPGNS
ncbi:TlpA family protein disulfide reductase [Zeaxanthinibacter sp. PT1]|uniref:TlpA family protein disulfide reductase n=1 Tax=Zeaxanthinibacter TaxID=561554 RepID=UPI00234A817D|nr:TlpA family protein disulfide reductase [Zeaxanthinibacter sp. PT1]MDC6351840.1 TlpA family protein disulfide reductase [Zeaxanthinibacter sp. PT1]